MGIHDRDYSRNTPPVQRAGQRSPLPKLGVTGVLIVICGVLFALRVFLPFVPVLVNTTFLPDQSAAQLATIKPSEFQYSDIQWGVVWTDTPRVVQKLSGPGSQRLGAREVWLGDRVVAQQTLRLDPVLDAWGSFSTAQAVVWHDPLLGWTGLQVWRFITFQFLHANLNHIVFNMLALFFFGGMVEYYLGRKRFLAFYLLCGTCGALMYLLLNGLGLAGVAVFGPKFSVPGLLISDPNLPLVGASAGVMGVVMAGAFLAPTAEVLFFFVIPMKLRTLAYGLVCFAVLAVFFGFSNAGGEAAHIGGALAGFYFIRNPHHLHGMFDFMGRFDPTSRTAKARVAARKAGVSGTEIDRILDKIRVSGLHSLDDEEKRTLREASRR